MSHRWKRTIKMHKADQVSKTPKPFFQNKKEISSPGELNFQFFSIAKFLTSLIFLCEGRGDSEVVKSEGSWEECSNHVHMQHTGKNSTDY